MADYLWKNTGEHQQDTHTVCTFTSPLTLEAWQDHLFLLKSAQQEPTSVHTHTHTEHTLSHTHGCSMLQFWHSDSLFIPHTDAGQYSYS